MQREINVNYGPAAANDVTGAIADYLGLAVLRPNVSGSSISQDTNARVNNYFAGYRFATPPASSPFGNLGRNPFRAPGLWQLDTGINKSFLVREGVRLQFPVSSSIS